jgi:hypothetical protein
MTHSGNKQLGDLIGGYYLFFYNKKPLIQKAACQRILNLSPEL